MAKSIEELLKETKSKREYNGIIESVLGNLKSQYEWYQDDTENDEIMRNALLEVAQDIAKLVK